MAVESVGWIIMDQKIRKEEVIADYINGVNLTFAPGKVLYRSQDKVVVLEDGDGVVRGKIYVNLDKGECQVTVNGLHNLSLVEMERDLDLMQRFVRVANRVQQLLQLFKWGVIK